jgi:hypothetical protein
LRPKLVEDGDVTDRYIVDANDEPVELLQIRRLDDAQAAALGRDRIFDGERSLADIQAAVAHAIEEKRAVEPGVKAAHQLVLAATHPLGTMVREHLEAVHFDLAGYRGVWVPGHDEDPVQLTA